MKYISISLVNLDGILTLILAIMFGPAILLAIVGLGLYKNHRKASKIFFILASVYLLISLGICGTLMLVN